MSAAGTSRPLQAAIVATGLFGAVLVLMPGLARAGFGWLMLGDPAAMDAWPAPALAYVTLLHGVLGAVMVGWALALLWVQRAPATPHGRWSTVAVSVGTWFVVDSTYSAVMGAWPNVALNAVFGAGFALALGLARPRATGPGA